MVAQNIKEIQDASSPKNIRVAVEQSYNAARDKVIGSSWRNLWEAASSGFGRAAAYTAAAIVIATALVIASQASIGNAENLREIASGFEPIGKMNVFQGLFNGTLGGLEFVLNPIGLAVIGIAGVAGATAGYMQEQQNLADARANASLREMLKDQAKSAEKTQEPELEAGLDLTKKKQKMAVACDPLYEPELDMRASAEMDDDMEADLDEAPNDPDRISFAAREELRRTTETKGVAYV